MIGKLHPLVVHLPIGFIYLAFLLEAYAYFRKPGDQMATAVKYGYLLSTLVAAMAVISGLILSSNGKFTPAYLQIHKWLGIAVLVIAGLVYFIKSGGIELAPKRSILLSTFLIVILSVAGHYGGMLTHGKDHLIESAPAPIQKLAGFEPALDFTDINPDSVLVYNDIIQPVLNNKCSRCHNKKHPSGQLITTNYSALAKGGEDAVGIVPGKPYESAIVTRASLPVQDSRFMPPDGEVLSVTEYEILKYWIAQGADTMMRFDSRKIPDELRSLVERDYDLDYTLRPHYEKIEIDSISTAVLNQLEEVGFKAQFLGENNFFLDVDYQNDTLSQDGLSALQTIADHIVFLNLSATHVIDTALNGISGLQNLVRLDLHGTNISSSAIIGLKDLDHLEVLNLHHTNVEFDDVVEVLNAPKIETVYLWETLVTEEQINSLRMSHPTIEMVGRSILSVLEVQSDTTDNNDE